MKLFTKNILNLILKINFLVILLNSSVLASESLKPEDIYKEVRCVVCEGQSIYDSNSAIAEDMKKIIKEQLKLGKDKEEILNYLKSKYGEYIILTPAYNNKTIILWCGPVVFFIICVIIAVRKTYLKKEI